MPGKKKAREDKQGERESVGLYHGINIFWVQFAVIFIGHNREKRMAVFAHACRNSAIQFTIGSIAYSVWSDIAGNKFSRKSKALIKNIASCAWRIRTLKSRTVWQSIHNII